MSMNPTVRAASVSTGATSAMQPAPAGSAELYDQARSAFAQRKYTQAAQLIEQLLAEHSAEADSPTAHGTTAARLLLARSYYHSAQLGRAEQAARSVLATDPAEAYAALLLGRTLERAGRREEAEPILRLARALGAPSDER